MSAFSIARVSWSDIGVGLLVWTSPRYLRTNTRHHHLFLKMSSSLPSLKRALNDLRFETTYFGFGMNQVGTLHLWGHPTVSLSNNSWVPRSGSLGFFPKQSSSYELVIGTSLRCLLKVWKENVTPFISVSLGLHENSAVWVLPWSSNAVQSIDNDSLNTSMAKINQSFGFRVQIGGEKLLMQSVQRSFRQIAL